MTLTERERHDAYKALEGAFGNNTDIVIAMLQPTHDLATREDLAVTRAELRGEMAEVRGEMAEVRGEMAEVRGEMAGLRTELKTEMADLRRDVSIQIAGVGERISGLEARLENRIADGFQHQIRSMLFTIMGAVVLLMLADALRSIVG